MKESILGRSRAFVMRMVALTGFILFIGIGTTMAQSYVSSMEAQEILRAEIDNLSNSTNASPFEYNGPEVYLTTNPQLYANWYLMASVNSYLTTLGPNADVRDAVVGALEKAIGLNSVNSFFFNQAGDYVEDLLTN